MTPRILAPYAKTASANTKEVLEKRSKGMKGMFDDDEIDPNQKVSDDLTRKLDLQAQAPLYDKEDGEHYKNLNDEEVGKDENAIDEEEIQTPDYQAIRNTVQ